MGFAPFRELGLGLVFLDFSDLVFRSGFCLPGLWWCLGVLSGLVFGGFVLSELTWGLGWYKAEFWCDLTLFGIC